MAWITGVLTNFDDFLTKFKSFVTTNSDLLGPDQEWEVLKDSAVDTDFADYALCTGANATSATTGPFIRRIYFKSRGLAGTDSIYHCLTSLKTAGGAYNIQINNMHSYSSAVQLGSQAGVSPSHYMLLNNSASTNKYWFFVNGRRAVMSVRIGSVYEHGMCGFGLPIGAPSEVPLPYMTGGSCSTYNLTASSVTAPHRSFFAPYISAAGATTSSLSTLSVSVPNSSTWIPIGNYSAASAAQDSQTVAVMPLRNLAGIGSATVGGGAKPQGFCYGNTNRKIRPISLVSSIDGFEGCFGEMDGIFYVSGEGLASEDTLNDGTYNYIVMQSTFYTDRESFCAIRMN
jgi:hypothetical protein